MLEIDVTKPLVPQELEVVPQEHSKVSIGSGDIGISLLEVQAVGVERGRCTLVDQQRSSRVTVRIKVKGIRGRGKKEVTVNKTSVESCWKP